VALEGAEVASVISAFGSVSPAPLNC
jgi:hypothetical protein